MLQLRRPCLMTTITPDILLKAYAAGLFPMAESAEDNALYWIDPELRGVIPLEEFHVPRRLRRTIKAQSFSIRINSTFEDVIDACAEAAPGRTTTWINDRIRQLYSELFSRGSCHTVEAWQGDRLVGGLYGVQLGAAFFGESMFSREKDASKVALVHLVARLKAGGFELLDTQFVTEHLMRFGAREIARDDYRVILERATTREADFYCFGSDDDALEVLQSVSQTS